MRKQLGILSVLFASLCAVCAYVMLAAILCTLTACTPTGNAAALPSPAASLPARPGQLSADPSLEPSLELPSDLSPEQSAPVPEPAFQPSALPSTEPPPVLSAPPAAQQAAFPQIPLDDYSLSIPVPDFLDEGQQLLYRQAHEIYSRLFGANVDIVIGTEDKFPELKDVVEYKGIAYAKATGLYAAWADFDAMVHSLFTDSFWNYRNAIQRGERYINIDGALYFLDLSRGAYYRNGNFPDTFTLISKTDGEISFTVTGYYSSPWPREGESLEARDQRLKDGWEYTLDFNIKLVRTADGWRFDSFHGTTADQEDPETAALSRKWSAQE